MLLYISDISPVDLEYARGFMLPGKIRKRGIFA